MRVMLAFVVDVRLITVSNGLLLNAMIISLLILASILCAIGEFCIRSFMVLQGLPRYIIRESITRQHFGEEAIGRDGCQLVRDSGSDLKT